MSAERKHQTAVIYARQSLDRTGEALAVARQIEECHRLATARGWTITAEYVDNDRSATTGAARPGFEELLAAEPERVVVWHVDRLVRLTRDLERVIDLGANVHAVKAGHIDLSSPAGRAVARTVTAWATYEGEQKALRQRAANDQRAAAGLPYVCQRAFGFEPDGMTVRDAEARELRLAAAGVLRGQSLNSLVQDLNDRDVRTATGRKWKTTTLKAALLSPRNAGLRRHRGEVIGKAAWPAILDEETAAGVRAILTDPARRRPGPNRRYLLSGVMRCEVCDKPISGAFIKESNKGPTYRCLGHVQRKAPPVDDFIRTLTIARLSQPDAIDMFAKDDDGPERAAQLTGERDSLRDRLDGLAEAFAAGDIDRGQLTKGSARLRDRLTAVEDELAGLVKNPALAEVVDAEDVTEAFDALPLEVQRHLIDELMTITLRRSGPGNNWVFNPDRSLQIEWRAGK